MLANSYIPFLDLVTPHMEMEAELVGIFRQALSTAGFIGGPMVEEFEKAFATYCTTRHAIAVSSGTDALRFALIAAGIKPGDVVLTVPNTFIATVEAITQAGAVAEFVDIDERTYNMSTEALGSFLENRCKLNESGTLRSLRNGGQVRAIVPVHLYGQMADMDGILELAEKYGLMVIEDACQAHGAEYYSQRLGRWMRAGSMGRAAAFSFYPGKNLGACGEAGAVVCDDVSIAALTRRLRDHGQSRKYYHDIEGYNGRLDAIQAGILTAKLSHLEKWNRQRRELAGNYNRLLAENDFIGLPFEPSWSRGVYHLYVVRIEYRDQLIEHLKGVGIGTGIHYPVPLHLQKAYEATEDGPGDFPVAEKVAAEIISLPMYPQLTVAQQQRVADEIFAFIAQTSGDEVEITASAVVGSGKRA